MKNVKAGHTHPIVCLDAGHYGSTYNRSPVVKDYYESEAMWKLTQYEKAELEKYGIEVWLTRLSQSQNPGLSARGRMSNGADLFKSNHSNACSTESVDRPVGIYLVDDDCGAMDEQSKEIAALMAETVRNVMQTKDKAQTYSKLAGSDLDRDGKKNDDYYGVLYGAHQVGTPGLILEHSFHTNTRSAKWLLDEDNLKLLAAAEAYTTAQWFGLVDAGSDSGTVPDADNQVKVEEKPKAEVKVDSAREFNKGKAGTYVVNSSDGILNLRSGPDSGKTLIEAMPSGSKVRCYGYYTGSWLYVVSAAGNKGFCHSGYLKKA